MKKAWKILYQGKGSVATQCLSVTATDIGYLWTRIYYMYLKYFSKKKHKIEYNSGTLYILGTCGHEYGISIYLNYFKKHKIGYNSGTLLSTTWGYYWT